ncbi:histidine--tRNA ligase [Gammaproteobacteria bacterium]|jgi:histidyl-tRNA synthetase|nr:histidine--tRNA ligase [Gammaproteobacteria bacterium]
MGTVQAVRGMNDILPDRSGVWQQVEGTLRSLFHAYSYYEIRLPLIEKTELFARSIGEATDIVAKEMYTFDDRNGESLSLRPEGTASCVRTGIEHGLFHNQWQRYWYMGPMFRHERPQRGRYRQFYQAGAEAFGWTGPDIDAELIALSARFWRGMKLQNLPRLEINSLGDTETRASYRRSLVDYLQRYEQDLDADSRKRMSSNPLRILDSKDAGTKNILQGAPDIITCLDAASRSHFDELCSLLQALEIQFTINPRLVRGLDYYNRTVFEWVTDELGAQGAVCAGGRYDGLVQQLGGKQPVPAAGFALGMDRLVELVILNAAASSTMGPDVYVITVGGQARSQGWKYAELLRDFGINAEMYCGNGVMKNQMKRADKSGALISLLLGEDEIASGSVTLKSMQKTDSQITIAAVDLVENVRKLIIEHRS